MADDLDLVKQVAQYFKTKNISHLLEYLPDVDTVTFEENTHTVDAHDKKLLIGCDRDSEDKKLYAYIFAFGDKPREARYFLEESGTVLENVLPHQLGKYQLYGPFFTVMGDGGQVGRRSVSNLAKYYFNLAGHITSWESGIPNDYCYRMNLMLKKLSAVPVSQSQTTFTGNALPRTTQNKPQQWKNRRGEKNPEEMGKFFQYFTDKNDMILFDHIPDIDEMRFEDQTKFPNGVPRKLYVGTTNREPSNEIWAYLLKFGANKYHEVRFYAKSRGFDSFGDGVLDISLSFDETIQSALVDPFRYVTAGTGQQEKARLTAIIKYYFVADGTTKGLPNEMKNMPYRVHGALEFIMAAKSDRASTATKEPVRKSQKTTTAVSNYGFRYPRRAVDEGRHRSKQGDVIPVRELWPNDSDVGLEAEIVDGEMNGAETDEKEKNREDIEEEEVAGVEMDDVEMNGKEVAGAFGENKYEDISNYEHDARASPARTQWERSSSTMVHRCSEGTLQGSTTPFTEPSPPQPPSLKRAAEEHSEDVATPSTAPPHPRGRSLKRKASDADAHFQELAEFAATETRLTQALNALKAESEDLWERRMIQNNQRRDLRDEIRRLSTMMLPQDNKDTDVTAGGPVSSDSSRRNAEDAHFENIATLVAREGELTRELNALDEEVEEVRMRWEAVLRQRKRVREGIRRVSLVL
ncbi:hypothetical protein GQ43DRAFT_461071 [Delitschia confertaspora ATCC 74209]|uniref:Uncharacterized protein n=1 Tax=Delitschia confertaspora ATCC 74209 TaxID=1513339 RepID=A0A9P4JTC8_9PLEO|nr:hypothetical protein GQ43DRAFT_461071 [Delitschia confertaspora ATCC 74209]